MFVQGTDTFRHTWWVTAELLLSGCYVAASYPRSAAANLLLIVSDTVGYS